MADTIVTNTPPANNDAGTAGWVVALIVLVAVIFGGIVMYQRGYFMQQAQTPSSTNINVTVPNPVTPAPTTP